MKKVEFTIRETTYYTGTLEASDEMLESFLAARRYLPKGLDKEFATEAWGQLLLRELVEEFSLIVEESKGCIEGQEWFDFEVKETWE